MEFKPFPKIPRLRREVIITEKIDGTNASIHIGDDGEFRVGSRTRFITPEEDNHGFARWAYANQLELMKLGPGAHYGEWWGPGIQRGYGLAEKCFSLFNVSRWGDDSVRPACCRVVPKLYHGPMSDDAVDRCLHQLRTLGSLASPGFMRPEGIVVFHTASGHVYKVTTEKDEQPKGVAA